MDSGTSKTSGFGSRTCADDLRLAPVYGEEPSEHEAKEETLRTGDWEEQAFDERK